MVKTLNTRFIECKLILVRLVRVPYRFHFLFSGKNSKKNENRKIFLFSIKINKCLKIGLEK